MREIKFRAWHKEKKVMIDNIQDTYDGLLFGPKDEDGYGTVSIYDVDLRLSSSFGNFLENDDVEVMQFTGIQDKKGQQIYEKDIVNVDFGKDDDDNYTGQVSFDYGKFWVVKHNGYGGEGYDFDFLCNKDLHSHTAKLEVVGNVFMNPELINN